MDTPLITNLCNKVGLRSDGVVSPQRWNRFSVLPFAAFLGTGIALVYVIYRIVCWKKNCDDTPNPNTKLPTDPSLNINNQPRIPPFEKPPSSSTPVQPVLQATPFPFHIFSSDRNGISFDIAFLICSHLSHRDIARMRKVCRKWNDVISKRLSPQLHQGLALSCVIRAENSLKSTTRFITSLFDNPAPSSDEFETFTRIEALKKQIAPHSLECARVFDQPTRNLHQDTSNTILLTIVKLEAQKNIETAKRIVEQIPDPGRRHVPLFFITEIQAQNNIPGAKETARSIQDLEYQYKALATIAEVEAQNNIPGAKETARSIARQSWKETAFLKIAIIEAQRGFTEAHQTVQLIQNSIKKDEALLAISKIEAESSDTARAKATAQLIQNQTYRARAFLAIAQIEASSNIAEAKKTASSMPPSKFKDRALLTIVQKETLDQAKTTAATIQDQSIRLFALLEIAKKTPSDDFTEAEAVARTLEEGYFLELVKARTERNLAAAKTWALALEPADLKNAALTWIVEVEASKSISDAIKTAEAIQDPSLQSSAFLLIVEEQVKNIDLRGAKETALTRHDKYLWKIVIEAEASVHIAEAKNTINQINASWKSELDISIVKAVAKKNPYQAWQVAKDISTNWIRARAFLEVAKAALAKKS